METRPVDQVMLIIEALILFFIVWEFGWKLKDWYSARKERKEYESEMAARLSHLSPEEATALEKLTLRGDQPPDQIALAITRKIQLLLLRDFVLGWGIAVEHRNYMRNWATERQKNYLSRK